MSFVITQLLEGSLAGRIAPGEVAVVGHSDGADVALMTAYEAGHVDGRVQAVVAMAPDPITDTVVQSTVPLLLIQGTADDVVPYSASAAVFAQVEAPATASRSSAPATSHPSSAARCGRRSSTAPWPTSSTPCWPGGARG